MDNANSQEYLQKIKVQVIENLKRTTFNPSVQMTDVPRDPEGMNDEADAEMDDLDDDENQDSRYTKRRWDKFVTKEGELSESEDEEENEANGVRKQPNAPKRRRNMMDFQNPAAAPDDRDGASGAVSARSGRSLNGMNGSRRSSRDNAEEEEELEEEEEGESEAEGANGDNPESSTPGSRRDEEGGAGGGAEEDEDVEMADDAGLDNGAPHSTDGAQEATPPDSPADIATDPTAPPHVVEDTGNDAMDEGDTLDDPELAKEEGHDEREKEDVDAEKTTEIVEHAED